MLDKNTHGEDLVEDHVEDGGEADTVYVRLLALAAAGATAPAATDAQKWDVGDAVARLQDLGVAAREAALDPERPATARGAGAVRAGAQRLEGFLRGQGVRRDTLVDYAHIARVFPTGDPVRIGGLTYSHARALCRVDDPATRAALADRALLEAMPVDRLQKEVNAMQDVSAPEAATGARRRASQHRQVCARTGLPITDVAAMVEVVLHEAPAANKNKNEAPEANKANGRERGRRKIGPRRYYFTDRRAAAAWLEVDAGAHGIDRAPLRADAAAPRADSDDTPREGE